MRLSNKIVLATLNLDKFDEFRELFSAYPSIELIPASQVLRNPEGLRFAERHDTYLDNAIAKARLCNLGAHYPSLADDSGLEVEILGGRPGVRSHRYATPKAGMSQDQANIELLLQEIRAKGVFDSSGTPARFIATLALVIEGILLHTTGVLEGKIVPNPRGNRGFGYDPVFVPAGSERTLAEMSALEKNKISHRAKALEQLMGQVEAKGLIFAKP